ncbi:DUF397 domain-containing protein [Micromonospora sp. LOL_023]|uniref:DUF397 domain-containing protein n=1 Tax=Micromonospora sp. LOL_023 TaxID=3345418 RepID=UPI003A8611F8
MTGLPAASISAIPVCSAGDPTEPLRWCKSSRSNANGNCVEAASAGEVVAVRDSTDPTGPVLAFPAAIWRSFVDSLR